MGVILNLGDITDKTFSNCSAEARAARERITGDSKWDYESYDIGIGFRLWKCEHKILEEIGEGYYRKAYQLSLSYDYAGVFTVYDYWDKVSHWCCQQEPDDFWGLYYVSKTGNKKLVERMPNRPNPKNLVNSFKNKIITSSSSIAVEDYRSEHRTQKVFYEDRQEGFKLMAKACEWSYIYNNKNILELLKDKPKCTFKDAKSVIEGEGGTIDADGVIHHK